MAQPQPIDLVCAIVFAALIVLICRAWLIVLPAIARARRRTAAWQPKSPLDCPLCRSAQPPCPALLHEVQPWRLGRSRRGAKKRYNSEGFACPNPDCLYFGCTVASIHALVSDGFRDKAERIHRWKCQACGRSVSERWQTPMYYLKTPSHRVRGVMTALAEGVMFDPGNPFRARPSARIAFRLSYSHVEPEHIVEGARRVARTLARWRG